MTAPASLLLVKHSLPEVERHRPAAEWHLGEAGRARCRLLAARVRPYAPAVVFASPEPKARETAELVADDLGVGVTTVDDLREHERRRVGWLDDDSFTAGVQAFFARPDELVLGEETAAVAAARFTAAVERLLVERPYESIVVVSHGTVITLFAAERLGHAPFELWRRLGLPSLIALRRPRLELVELVDAIGAEPSLQQSLASSKRGGSWRS